jgi:hypothetical protein
MKIRSPTGDIVCSVVRNEFHLYARHSKRLKLYSVPVGIPVIRFLSEDTPEGPCLSLPNKCTATLIMDVIAALQAEATKLKKRLDTVRWRR